MDQNVNDDLLGSTVITTSKTVWIICLNVELASVISPCIAITNSSALLRKIKCSAIKISEYLPKVSYGQKYRKSQNTSYWMYEHISYMGQRPVLQGKLPFHLIMMNSLDAGQRSKACLPQHSPKIFLLSFLLLDSCAADRNVSKDCF